MINSIKKFCVLDEATEKQVNQLINLNCLDQAQIRIMADAHMGVDVCIGFSALLKQDAKIIDPRIVSNDIGCGITILKLKNFKIRNSTKFAGIKSTFQYIDSFIRGSQIDLQKRFGLGSFQNLLKISDEIPEIELASQIVQSFVDSNKITSEQANHINETFATIGNGNHFIEMLKNDQNEIFISMHSGSRALGGAINEYWMKQVVEQKIQEIRNSNNEKIKSIPNIAREEFVKSLNIDKNKIKNKLKEFEVSIELYYQDVSLSKKWAELSRITALKLIIREFNTDYELFCNVSHNFLDFFQGRYIVRKGAVPAYKGELVAIALNMAEGIVIGKGKGNLDYNYTAPHGAGRKYSRRQALKNHTMEEFVEIMQTNEVYSSTVNIHTLDETPQAYKNSEDIIKTLSDTLDDFYILKPIYNFKCEN